MIKKVFKYELSAQDTQVLLLPQDAQVLSVHAQGNGVCLWALVDVEKRGSNMTRVLRTAGTGHTIEVLPGRALDHLGTVFLEQGRLVFHVFEEVAAQ